MITYEIFPEEAVVVLRYEEAVNDADLVDAYRRLHQDPAWRPGLAEFVDVRGADPQFSAEALREVAELTADALGAGTAPIRTAVLVSRNVGFGLARMYEAYSETAGESEQVRVFRDPVEALDWLEISPDLIQGR